ncbi:MAG: carbon-phosphorus lyase complex subunit PhnI, partial [Litorilinea sp.]
MAYVATRGGEDAIQQAERFFQELRGPITADFVQQILAHMPLLVDRVMGESSLYAPELAALALAQTGGDLYESVLLLRAYRSTQPRLAYATTVRAAELLTVRRISAAFKDIPGGQVLGPTLDYSHRLLDLSILDNASHDDTRDGNSGDSGMGDDDTGAVDPAAHPAPRHYPAVADWQRAQGWLGNRQNEPAEAEIPPQEIPDVTREPLVFPAPRAHRLQMLARADTGGALSLAYSSMRGYGLVHPTVNELRLAYAPVRLRHPVSGVAFSAGRVRVSQAEIVTTGGSSEDPGLEVGFCATLGWNEVKTIAGSTLDLAMSKAGNHPAHAEEFVLYHTEAVEASGFCIHFKLPHYVTFTSSLDNLRGARENATRRMVEGQYVQTLYAGGDAG